LGHHGWVETTNKLKKSEVLSWGRSGMGVFEKGDSTSIVDSHQRNDD
jgi:hypothetical protein